jgi:hypothetical protein
VEDQSELPIAAEAARRPNLNNGPLQLELLLTHDENRE